MHYVTHFLFHADPFLIYCIVGIVLALESSGVPIANSTLLLCTGALASLGHVNILELGIVAVVGSSLGACMAYYLGQRGGRIIFFRLAKLLRIQEQKVLLVERWFQRSGLWMIFFSRMLPYVRPFACFPAGIMRAKFSLFFLCSSSGSIIWCLAVLSIGWNLGKRWNVALQAMQYYTLPTVGVIVLCIVLYLIGMFWIKRLVATRVENPLSVSEAQSVDEHKRDLLKI